MQSTGGCDSEICNRPKISECKRDEARDEPKRHKQRKSLKKCVTQGIIKRDRILSSKGARKSYTSTKIVRNKADWQADL